jgi:hypothetical protein
VIATRAIEEQIPISVRIANMCDFLYPTLRIHDDNDDKNDSVKGCSIISLPTFPVALVIKIVWDMIISRQ